MKIMDTTIRDGSYAVDFKFTCKDVSNIVSKLVNLGIEYIEIGHGMGLNASSPEHGISLYSDVEYIEAARKVAGNSKLGMFCIPGIARIEDLTTAKEHGIDFVRIGISADKLDNAKEYIVKAKEVGLIVMVNFMKTYVFTPEYIAEQSETAMSYGAEYIYLVDSAGTMLPEELCAYFNAIKAVNSNIKVGYHGHNNIGMAVANSIACTEAGFEFIDCSFQGLGRSIGNTSTEMFVMALQKKHGTKYVDMDIPKLLEYGYVSLKDIRNIVLQNPLDLVCGYAGFHSSFLKDIFRCCCKYEVDPLRLIIAYSEVNKNSMDYDELCKIAQNLPKDDSVEDHPYNFRRYFSAMYSL
ncbi:MAG: 4-hydroxy-2-oxovalerate aldolase [Candidatus Gastranaerophilaceae bacterium]